jgi:uncharacterized protein (DUF433 family)
VSVTAQQRLLALDARNLHRRRASATTPYNTTRKTQHVYDTIPVIMLPMPRKEYPMDHEEVLAAIERDNEILSGVWVFRGTRVPVSALFENLRDGATIDQFLEWFPGVTRAQVEAVLEYEMQHFAEVV